ncbi:uncharacterized protein [Bemisia tabaci]|uniref:uncharacterized protein n=1 Tax=Bemisia tabaci TaxID=7038 RepID=UPI0008F9B982|nr:PREDICTED: uncharacterized protein LOC109033185 [Bemisia tabaci]
MSAPASSDSSSIVAKFGKIAFKPVNRDTVLFHYAPILGAANYGLLSVNVMNPSILGGLFPNRDVTNILLLHSFAGIGLHIYNRPHLQNVQKTHRILYSAYGSLVFSFGSVLIWAVLSRLFPGSKCVATMVGVGAGLTLTIVGKEYLDHIDSQTPKK